MMLIGAVVLTVGCLALVQERRERAQAVVPDQPRL
jgi:hypothetical protein